MTGILGGHLYNYVYHIHLYSEVKKKKDDTSIPIYLDFSAYNNELALLLHELLRLNLQITLLNKYYHNHLYNQQNYGSEVNLP